MRPPRTGQTATSARNRILAPLMGALQARRSSTLSQRCDVASNPSKKLLYLSDNVPLRNAQHLLRNGPTGRDLVGSRIGMCFESAEQSAIHDEASGRAEKMRKAYAKGAAPVLPILTRIARIHLLPLLAPSFRSTLLRGLRFAVTSE